LGPLGGLLRGSQQRALLAELEALRRQMSSQTQKAAHLYLGYAGALREQEKRAHQLAGELKAAASQEHRAIEDYKLQHRSLA
jgi:ABC-type phosphate transport system auxiliary subunit